MTVFEFEFPERGLWALLCFACRVLASLLRPEFLSPECVGWVMKSAGVLWKLIVYNLNLIMMYM